MKARIALGLVLILAAAPAAAMPVSTFLSKAEALKGKGPLAMFSGDLKLLMNQVKADSVQLREENKLAEAAGKPKAYCTPNGFKMNQNDIMAAMQQVPVAQRGRTTTKEALRAYIARRHPCRT